MPLFSIITVCLNAGDELKKTIESVLCQTFGDYEIIVKDGGSKDGSVEGLAREKGCDIEESSGLSEGDGGNIGVSGKCSEGDDGNTEVSAKSSEDDDKAADGEGGKNLPGARIRMINKKDTGIYDAMNQAIDYAAGVYCIFLNAGDYLYDERVLERAAEFLGAYAKAGAPSETGKSSEKKSYPENAGNLGGEASEKSDFWVGANNLPKIVYGDIYNRQQRSHISSPPDITPFVCYRNLPCHQACFYSTELLRARDYDTRYRVRADYDHFLHAYFKLGIKPADMGFTVASYQGGGYSETEKGIRLSEEERREIIKKYMSPLQIKKYRLIMILSLQPLRKRMAENPKLSGIYQRVKTLIYKKK